MARTYHPEIVDYRRLNARQKESYNFQKASAVLADYGFTTIRLSDDWNGADFIAQHADGRTVLRAQLKGRLDVRKKYTKKDLWLCFRSGDRLYFGPHDSILKLLLGANKIVTSKSWRRKGGYSFPRLSVEIRVLLKQFALGATDRTNGADAKDQDAKLKPSRDKRKKRK